jgi:dihydrofolate reductase/thymidylate synthase
MRFFVVAMHILPLLHSFVPRNSNSCRGFLHRTAFPSSASRVLLPRSHHQHHHRQRYPLHNDRTIADYSSTTTTTSTTTSITMTQQTSQPSNSSSKKDGGMGMIAIVAAAETNGGIGFEGGLPWKSLKADMAHFKRVTSNGTKGSTNTNAVIMGRKTWESIPPKFRPLPGRTNVVLSRQFLARSSSSAMDEISNNNENQSNSNSDAVIEGEANAKRLKTGVTIDLPEGVIGASSLEDATEKLSALENVGDVFIIGGSQIYKEALESNHLDRVYYTRVGNCPADMKFDAFFPKLDDNETWECVPFSSKSPNTSSSNDSSPSTPGKDEKSGLTYEFLEYRRRDASSTMEISSEATSTTAAASSSESPAPSIPEGPDVNPEEMQYLDLCREILESGIQRGDRTGTGTLSKFGVQMRFSLRDNTMPLLTTKRTFWRGVAEELLWFISGNTNANDLQKKDIHIWDGNGSREFLDSHGLEHREVGDLGPVYGFQWRHFGAEYKDMHADYTGKGVDQLADCIDKIKNNPEDRRIIMSAWNPADLHLMALPPCHMFCQFYVDTTRGELSCQMYQRSADMGLGVPFNIASYSLLTHMMAHVCGLKAGDFVHTIGDAHVYLNHVDALKEQLQRQPRAFPKLKMNSTKTDIDSFEYADFELDGYKPHKTIKMKMAV